MRRKTHLISSVIALIAVSSLGGLGLAQVTTVRMYDIQGAGHNDTWQTGGKAYFDTLERFIQKNIKKETLLEEKS